MRRAQHLSGTHSGRLESRPLVGLAVADTPVRAAYAYALTANGFDVRLIDDAAAASTAALARTPDVVIVDVSADSGYGWKFVQSLKSDDRAADIPVIAVAAAADEGTRAQARRAQCAAVCARTCPPALLSSGIRAVLEVAAAALP